MYDEPDGSRLKKFVEEYECVKRKNGEPCRMNGAEMLKIMKKNDFDGILKLARDYESYRLNCARVEAKMLSIFTVAEFFESILPDMKKAFQMPHIWLTVIEGGPLSGMMAQAMDRKGVHSHLSFIDAKQFNSFLKGNTCPLYICNYTSPYALFFPENNSFTVRSLAILPLHIDGVLAGSINFGHFVSNRFASHADNRMIEQFMIPVCLFLSKIAAHEKLKYMASHDWLTGLLNRESFTAELKRQFGWSLRNGRGLSVLFLDLDGYNGLNDLYGHDFGDKAVQYLAKTILSKARPEDIATRFTGDEFVLLLPGSRGDLPEATASRIQDYLDQNPFNHENIQFRLSLYYGAASIDEKNIENPAHLLQTAYKRLKASRTDEARPLQEENKALIYKIRAS